MTNTYLLIISYRPQADIPVSAAFSKAVEKMHEVAAGRFAIVFPNARRGQAPEGRRTLPPSLGDRIHVFAEDKEVLEIITAVLGQYEEVLYLDNIAEIFANSGPYIANIRRRDHYRTKATIARELRRAEKRAAARGEKITVQELKSRFASLRRPKASEALPHIAINSKSTGKRVVIHFDMVNSNTPGIWSVDSFGFSKGGAITPAV